MAEEIVIDVDGHRVIGDTAGWGGHPRLTCYGEQCNGKTIVRQPKMSLADWEIAREAFLKQHGGT